jgi:hypothetical protein
LLIASTFWSAAYAATVTQIGTAGIDGTAGAAGDPGTAGGAGTDGGDANATASTVNTDASNTATATGGSGGSGGAGGNGVDGPDAGSAANGGAGGAGGAGGDASAMASTMVITGDATATARAGGGRGGYGWLGGSAQGPGVSGANGVGGTGGNAYASATATAPGTVNVSASAQGGAGGFGGIDLFEHAAPGTAALGPVTGTSTGGGAVWASGGLVGGDGASGGDVAINDMVDGNTTGSLRLTQRAFGGSAVGMTDGDGGSATSSILKSGSFTDLTIETEVWGGFGRVGGAATGLAYGANDSGPTTADVHARGGEGNGSDGGAAEATAEAHGASDTQFSLAIAFAEGGESTDSGEPGEAGGDATSHATAVESGTMWTLAMSSAYAGSGITRGGDATAAAHATGGIGSAAQAAAIAGVGAGASPDGLAIAHASTVTVGVGAADAGAQGGGGNASAETLVTGLTGSAFKSGYVSANAPVASDGVTSSSSAAKAYAGEGNVFYGSPDPATRTNLAATVEMAMFPDAAMLDAVLAGNAENGAAFGSTSGADPLLLGIMGGGYAADGSGGPYTFTSGGEFSFDPAQLAGGDLLIGLLNPAATGTGFDSLQLQIYLEDVLVLDQTFDDLPGALASFEDNVINFGDWHAGLAGDLDLAFELNLIASNPGDAFYFNVLAGTAAPVPIPGAVWLFGSGVLLLIRVGRRPVSSR